jgi:hypothetical protein
LFAGASVFAGAAELAFEGTANASAGFASAGNAAFASAGSAALAFVSAPFGSESAGVSTAVLSTEMLPLSAGIEIINADSINTTAATIVIFERTVAVPRGPNALLETLLVNSAPASVFPGWSSTDATSTMHEAKNNVYKTYINFLNHL